MGVSGKLNVDVLIYILINRISIFESGVIYVIYIDVIFLVWCVNVLVEYVWFLLCVFVNWENINKCILFIW